MGGLGFLLQEITGAFECYKGQELHVISSTTVSQKCISGSINGAVQPFQRKQQSPWLDFVDI